MLFFFIYIWQNIFSLKNQTNENPYFNSFLRVTLYLVWLSAPFYCYFSHNCLVFKCVVAVWCNCGFHFLYSPFRMWAIVNLTYSWKNACFSLKNESILRVILLSITTSFHNTIWTLFRLIFYYLIFNPNAMKAIKLLIIYLCFSAPLLLPAQKTEAPGKNVGNKITTSHNGKPTNYPQAKLEQKFSSYELYQVDFSELKEKAKTNNYFEINLELGTGHRWNIDRHKRWNNRNSPPKGNYLQRSGQRYWPTRTVKYLR